jgi:hypothetical protein
MQSAGVGVALHPSSESPVAVRFRGGTADSAALILTPGQIVNVGTFATFEYGLPFGWLGGGTSILYILHNDKAVVDFGNSEKGATIFHRARYVIENAFPGTLRKNWPGTFPWQSAARTNTVNPMPEGGAPIVALDMEIALMRLRSAIAAPATVTMIWQGNDAFDADAAGVVSSATRTTYDVTFPAVPAGSGAFPIAWLPREVHRLTSSVTGVNFIDPTGALNGQFIDVVRYCRFG